MRRLTRNSLKSIMVRCFYFNWLLLIRWVFWISVLCNYLSSWGIFTFQLMKCCRTVKRGIYTTGMEKRVLNNTLLAEEAEVLEWTFKTYLASMFSSYSSTLSLIFFFCAVDIHFAHLRIISVLWLHILAGMKWNWKEILPMAISDWLFGWLWSFCNNCVKPRDRNRYKVAPFNLKNGKPLILS